MSRVSAPARGRTLLLRFHGAAPSGITRDERVDQAFELFDAATRHAEPSRHLLDGGNRSRKHRSSCVPHELRVSARAQKRQCLLTDAVLVDSCRAASWLLRVPVVDEDSRDPSVAVELHHLELEPAHTAPKVYGRADAGEDVEQF